VGGVNEEELARLDSEILLVEAKLFELRELRRSRLRGSV